MDRVRQCHLLTPFKKVHKNFIVSSGKNINSASKVVNWIFSSTCIFINIMLSLAEFYLGGHKRIYIICTPTQIALPCLHCTCRVIIDRS